MCGHTQHRIASLHVELHPGMSLLRQISLATLLALPVMRASPGQEQPQSRTPSAQPRQQAVHTRVKSVGRPQYPWPSWQNALGIQFQARPRCIQVLHSFCPFHTNSQLNTLASNTSAQNSGAPARHFGQHRNCRCRANPGTSSRGNPSAHTSGAPALPHW